MVQAGLDSADWEDRQAALRGLRALLPAARDYRDRVAILLHTVTQMLNMVLLQLAEGVRCLEPRLQRCLADGRSQVRDVLCQETLQT